MKLEELVALLKKTEESIEFGQRVVNMHAGPEIDKEFLSVDAELLLKELAAAIPYYFAHLASQ